MSGTKKGRGSTRLGVVLFAIAALMSFGVSLTLAAPPFTATIDVDDITDFTVTVSGTAGSPSNAIHHMVIDWGDGNEDVLPNFDTDAPWNWGPVSHTYAEAGTYTVTATLVHANPRGNDEGAASASTEVTVTDPCPDGCPTDDGTTDDGATDGTTDDGTTDGTVQPPATEVQGKAVTKKPVVKSLAKTGPETTGFTVMGLVFLMAGATIRLLSSKEDEAALAAASNDLTCQAFGRSSRDRMCNG